MRTCILSFLLLNLTIALTNCSRSKQFSYVLPGLDSTIVAKKVSINNLVREYKTLQGQYIETEGTFFFAFEEFAIYTDKKFFSNDRDGFWLETNRNLKLPLDDWIPIKTYQGRKVTVKGRVDAARHGHLGGYLATITNIYYFKAK